MKQRLVVGRRVFHVNHCRAKTKSDVTAMPVSLADAELREDDVQQILDVDGAGNPAEPVGGKAQIVGTKLKIAAVSLQGRFQMRGGLAQQFDMAQARRKDIARIADGLYSLSVSSRASSSNPCRKLRTLERERPDASLTRSSVAIGRWIQTPRLQAEPR